MNSVLKYYRKSVRDLTDCFLEIRKNYNTGTVHEMRIVYKRIRAMNKLIRKELKGPEFLNLQNGTLDSVYQYAGRAREIHIDLKLLKKYSSAADKSFDEFSVFLENKMGEINSTLNELIGQTEIKEIPNAADKIYPYLSGLNEKNIMIKGIKFIKRKTRKIDTLCFEGSEMDRYHAIRTNFKDILFFAELFFTRKDFSEYGFRLNRLKNIGIKLGEWHDNQKLLDSLHNFFKINHITNYNTPVSRYKGLLDHILNVQHAILKSIHRKIIKTNLDLDYSIRRLEMRYY